MAFIDQNIIDDILRKTDIVDVIGEQVALSKQGKSYFGLCPFHSEKTPSFSVEPVRGIYNCFSCGEKGNAITFLQKTKNLSFVDAIKSLADRANVELDVSHIQVNPNKHLFDINKEATQFYEFYLKNTKSGEQARNYLETRSLSNEIIERFHLGLAPSEFDVLTKTLVDKGFVETDMVDLGLVKQSESGKFYDLFRGRIIFPIMDENGNTVAFSGRTYLDSDKEQPKYINSPQTKIFTKSNILYNLNNALTEIKNTRQVYLLEGYMDVIALYRAGIKNAVASMGTSLTNQQVTIIQKYANEVVICYDGDKPGIEATSRAMEMFKSTNLNIKIIQLPQGLDPDDYINKYSEDSLKERLEKHWVDPFEFRYNTLKNDVNFDKMLEIEKFKKDIFTMIKDSPNTIVDAYLKLLSTDTSLNSESVKQDFHQFTRRNVTKTRSSNRPQVQIENKYQKAERKMLYYFIKDKKYTDKFEIELSSDFCIMTFHRDFRWAIEDIYYDKNDENYDSIQDEDLYHALSPEQIDFYEKYVMYKDEELSDEEFLDFLDTLKEYKFNLGIKQLTEAIENETDAMKKIELALQRDKLKEDFHGQR